MKNHTYCNAFLAFPKSGLNYNDLYRYFKRAHKLNFQHSSDVWKCLCSLVLAYVLRAVSTKMGAFPYPKHPTISMKKRSLILTLLVFKNSFATLITLNQILSVFWSMHVFAYIDQKANHFSIFCNKYFPEVWFNFNRRHFYEQLLVIDIFKF